MLFLYYNVKEICIPRRPTNIDFSKDCRQIICILCVIGTKFVKLCYETVKHMSCTDNNFQNIDKVNVYNFINYVIHLCLEVTSVKIPLLKGVPLFSIHSMRSIADVAVLLLSRKPITFNYLVLFR